MVQDVPGGTVHKNLPAIAGDGFNPWSRKIPHTIEQRTHAAQLPKPTHSRAREPQLLS